MSQEENHCDFFRPIPDKAKKMLLLITDFGVWTQN